LLAMILLPKLNKLKSRSIRCKNAAKTQRIDIDFYDNLFTFALIEAIRLL